MTDKMVKEVSNVGIETERQHERPTEHVRSPHYQNRTPPGEVLFFPDDELPCYSFYGRSTTMLQNTPCTNRPACNNFHYPEDYDRSSMMKIIDILRSARKIELCMYKFSLIHIGNLFIALKNNGAQIRIITNNSSKSIDSDQIPRMVDSGIEVRENFADVGDGPRTLMHNKFAIIDDNCYLLGSFNWTHNGAKKNHESLIKGYEPNIVGGLVQKFNELWFGSQIYYKKPHLKDFNYDEDRMRTAFDTMEQEVRKRSGIE